ncbi:methylated-DNA--[protein]-cysteine S-methyltransferase [Corynebacterium poyangense]|uniref:Methylated-DNA--protein-cysteine methyltransferase n=1 Tax=Corynebacterium poyangense TaxID=2684405 RepID=A0A7H0SQV7_9CORY|nr:methylated-DNA--[protein]-cysteine S-methyltransferase [Corynebacterium poyangense]MBZ8176349.1 methylated-DNA--[protein]-cysteine S-methyltransferase [Corynebacterium poyangense]QNQ90932.1 methylated-DNA--[protein]-cysteine S-methyltransferase [Corynebacterium poyangense]
MSQHSWIEFLSPLGQLRLISDDTALLGVYYPHTGPLTENDAAADHPILCQAATELEQYFAGQRRIFEVPYRLRGTSFQKKVWSELEKIPFGTWISYGELARRIAQPRAARQVGQAVGANPLSIIVGCHRVLGVHQNLTGYAGGLERKRFLLDLENISWKE